MNTETDLLIIGGGPAGLCAAISGASEGLRVTLLDNGHFLGGQAKESNAIENYPGFPGGVTGDKLMGCFVKQANDFHSSFITPTQAVKLVRDGTKLITSTDDYNEYASKAVLISIGLQYRRLDAKGIGPLMGRGVYYGAPTQLVNDPTPKNIAIIGGANSAGQAALKLASNPKNNVTIFIRKTLDLGMSQYLVDRIRKAKNIVVCEHCEVTEVYGISQLEMIKVKHSLENDLVEIQDHEMDCMFIFIGAMPRTLWLENTVKLDSQRYISTGYEAAGTGTSIPALSSPAQPRLPLPMETSLAGVFAAGDVRSGSSKRVAVAAGEGATALQNVHKYLGELNGK